MFIVSLTYTCELSQVDAHLDDHIAFLQQAYADGYFIASGRKIPRTGGVILAQAKTRTELETLLARDPFHRAKVARYEIIEFAANMAARGFAKLLHA